MVAVPEEFMLFNEAITSQTQPEAGPSFTGDLAGRLFPYYSPDPMVMSWTRSRICLERGRLTFTRIIRVPSPLRS